MHRNNPIKTLQGLYVRKNHSAQLTILIANFGVTAENFSRLRRNIPVTVPEAELKVNDFTATNLFHKTYMEKHISSKGAVKVPKKN